MKLITEHNEDLEYLSESINGTKKLMIEGIFMQANRKNRNGRIYPKEVLEPAVSTYHKEQVKTNRAVGELGHPSSPTVNLDRVSHRITELRWDGDNVVGRAQVLDTPMGQIVKGLMEADVRLGVSTRGMGSLYEKSGTTYVKDDFRLSTVDVVQDPSAPDAMVNGILEGVEYFIENGTIKAKEVDGYKRTLRHASDDRMAEAQIKLLKEFLNRL